MGTEVSKVLIGNKEILNKDFNSTKPIGKENLPLNTVFEGTKGTEKTETGIKLELTEKGFVQVPAPRGFDVESKIVKKKEAPVVVEQSRDFTYTIKAGDTLGGIAKRLKETEAYKDKSTKEIIDELVKKNGLKDKNRIVVGKELKVDGEVPESKKTTKSKSKKTKTITPPKQDEKPEVKEDPFKGVNTLNMPPKLKFIIPSKDNTVPEYKGYRDSKEYKAIQEYSKTHKNPTIGPGKESKQETQKKPEIKMMQTYKKEPFLSVDKSKGEIPNITSDSLADKTKVQNPLYSLNNGNRTQKKDYMITGIQGFFYQ